MNSLKKFKITPSASSKIIGGARVYRCHERVDGEISTYHVGSSGVEEARGRGASCRPIVW